MRADSLSLTEEVSQYSISTSSGVFPQQEVGEKDSVLLSHVECTARGLTQKKALFPCSSVNLGSCFMSQDEGMSESCLEILE